MHSAVQVDGLAGDSVGLVVLPFTTTKLDVKFRVFEVLTTAFKITTQLLHISIRFISLFTCI